MALSTLERTAVQAPLRGTVSRALVDDAQRIDCPQALVTWASRYTDSAQVTSACGQSMRCASSTSARDTVPRRGA